MFMARGITWMILASTLAAGVASAHPPHDEAAPDPTLRFLSLISTSNQSADARPGYGKTQVEGLGLSFDPATSMAASHAYKFQDSMRAVVCIPPSDPYCGGQKYAVSSAQLANASEDMQLAWADAYHARLGVTWRVQEHGPSVFQSGLVAQVHVHLSVADTSYGGMSFYTTQPSGSKVFEWDFQREVYCQQQHRHDKGGSNESECKDDFNETRPDLWAHDLRLDVSIYSYDGRTVSLGRTVVVELATDGTSGIVVNEFVPEPVVVQLDVPPEGEETDFEAISESRVDGASAEPEAQVALPAPSLLLALVGVGAGMRLWRRR